MKKYYAVLTDDQVKNQHGDGLPDLTDENGGSLLAVSEDLALDIWKERRADGYIEDEPCTMFEIWLKPIKRSPSTEWTLISE